MKHSVIGTNSVVLPGVVMYEGAAVGAMSLVKNNVDSFTIVGGIPAKKIRNRNNKIMDLEINFLQKNFYENK